MGGDPFDKLRDLVKEFDPNEERIKIRRYLCFARASTAST